MMRYFLIVIIAVLEFGSLYAQEQEPAIQVLGRATEKSIKLRWAPDTPLGWKFANDYGYMIERVTILRDGVLLDTPEKVTLTNEPLKPFPLALWEPMAEKNDLAGVAAQALYGEDFEIDKGNMENAITQVTSKSKELELRFSFGLFAADQSVEVAEAMGLFFEDFTAQENEKYLYRIYSLLPVDAYPLEEGKVYVGLSDYVPLPQPIDFAVEFGNRSASIRWNRIYFEEHYNSFWVERSDDGENFEPITSAPLVNTYEKDSGPVARYMYKLDSLPVNGKKYYYRVKGISAFGEIGPPSEVISGKGIATLGFLPVIEKAGSPDNMKVELGWKIPAEFDSVVYALKIYRAPSAAGPFQLLDSLPKSVNRYTDSKPLFGNYYKLGVIDQYEIEHSSMAKFVQLVDSIPPSVPQKVKGEVDTAGVVRLNWAPNPDQDIAGYRIYRANNLKEEFALVNPEVVEKPSFTESISVRNLNKQVFYKVMAIDLRLNHSSFSEVCTIRLPNMVPPSAPVISEVLPGTSGVKINWIPSTEDDVAYYSIYRKAPESDSWDKIGQVASTKEPVFQDTTAASFYSYTIKAVNERGLESKRSPVVNAEKIRKKNVTAVTKIFENVDREKREIRLRWVYPTTNVVFFQIYRAEEDEPLRLYKTVKAEENEFVDRSLQVNTTYNYRIKAVLRSGVHSAFSKNISINF